MKTSFFSTLTSGILAVALCSAVSAKVSIKEGSTPIAGFGDNDVYGGGVTYVTTQDTDDTYTPFKVEGSNKYNKGVALERDWFVEASGFVGWSHDKTNEDVFGLGATTIYGGDFLVGTETFIKQVSLNFRVSYFSGDDTVLGQDATGTMTRSSEQEIEGWKFMPGFRFTENIAGKLDFFAGFNVGLASVEMTQEITEPGFGINYTGDKLQLAYNAEVGISYRLTDNFSVFTSYNFFGMPGVPTLSSDLGQPLPSDFGGEYPVDVESDNLLFHMIRLGANYRF